MLSDFPQDAELRSVTAVGGARARREREREPDVVYVFITPRDKPGFPAGCGVRVYVASVFGVLVLCVRAWERRARDMFVFVLAYVHACVHACVRACARACVRA